MDVLSESSIKNYFSLFRSFCAHKRYFWKNFPVERHIVVAKHMLLFFISWEPRNSSTEGGQIGPPCSHHGSCHLDSTLSHVENSLDLCSRRVWTRVMHKEKLLPCGDFSSSLKSYNEIGANSVTWVDSLRHGRVSINLANLTQTQLSFKTIAETLVYKNAL